MDVMDEYRTSRPVSMQELYNYFIGNIEQYVKCGESSDYYKLKGFIEGLRWTGVLDSLQGTVFNDILSEAHDFTIAKKEAKKNLYKRLIKDLKEH